MLMRMIAILLLMVPTCQHAATSTKATSASALTGSHIRRQAQAIQAMLGTAGTPLPQGSSEASPSTIPLVQGVPLGRGQTPYSPPTEQLGAGPPVPHP